MPTNSKEASKVSIFSKLKTRAKNYFDKDVHKSFRYSKKRDYKITTNLPGYLGFVGYVNKILLANWRIFTPLVIVYILTTVLMIGIASQDYYSSLLLVLNDSGADMLNSFWGSIGGAGLLFITAITGGLSQSLTDVQQLYATVISVIVWLTIVWLLRNILSGNKIKFRDGLYNSGAPIVPTILIGLLILVQMIPIIIAVIAYIAASSTGLLDSGIEAMLLWMFAGLMSALSLYWFISSFFALVIVTLPGMYPIKAIKSANELVMGRRLQILMRILLMALIVIVSWALILIPAIIFDAWMKNVLEFIAWLPIIPIVILILSSMSFVWMSSYIYLLYRKVIADAYESN